MQSAWSSRLPSQPHPEIRAMFEARKRVFVDLLRWNVPVLDGKFEIDQYDLPDAQYLVLADEHQNHRASARLLLTDGPHILAELFPCLCEESLPSGASIREITRFCIEPALSRNERRRARDQLITALVEHALRAGITHYVAVAEVGWFKQISNFGWKCRPLGPAQKTDGQFLVALQLEIDSNTSRDLARSGMWCPAECIVADREGIYA